MSELGLLINVSCSSINMSYKGFLEKEIYFQVEKSMFVTFHLRIDKFFLGFNEFRNNIGKELLHTVL